jgi:hypothetical protein
MAGRLALASEVAGGLSFAPPATLEDATAAAATATAGTAAAGTASTAA